MACILRRDGPRRSPSTLVRPVFVDNTAPSLGTPTVTYSTTTERTATVSWSSEPLSKAECRLDGAAAAPCSGLTSHTMTLPEGGHTLSVRGTDIAGNVGSFTADVSVRIIETALVSGPADVSNEKSPTFTFFTANGSTFDCSVDNLVLAACGSKDPSNNRASKQFSNLAEGKHTFRVRARNGGDIDATTLVRTWTVDTVAPTATLSTATGPGEGALQAVNREPFTFSADEDATFQCRLDGAEFAACASGVVLENLTAGAHRFEVRAVDAAGNVGAAVARNWAVAAPTAAPLVITQTQVVERLVFTVAFFATAKAKTTKFASLQVKNVPQGRERHRDLQGQGLPVRPQGQGLHEEERLRHGEPGRVHQEVAEGRRQDHGRRSPRPARSARRRC